jgi:peptide/nickel transport system substrate-binding protein
MDVNDVHIIPRHVFGKIPFEKWQSHGEWQEQATVCSGAWLLESYKRNQEITFVPNPRYWEKGKPYLARVVFRIFADMQTLLSTVLSGDVDFFRSIQPDGSMRVLSSGHLNLYTFVTRNAGWIGWNCSKPPFDDVRVRNAMTHAIDRENIVESLFYGYADVAGPVMIRSMWASNAAIQPLEFDPEKAGALLDEAGWRKGEGGLRRKDGKPLQFNMVTNKGNVIREKICEYAQSNLAAIGVKVDVNLMDFNQMSQQLKRHNFDSYVSGLSYATKADGMALWHSSAAEGRYNYVAYSNPRVDKIIEQARVMFDQRAAKPLWDELQEIMHREQPYTMLYEPRGLVALAKRFQDAEMTSLRVLTNLHEWWVPKEQQKYK